MPHLPPETPGSSLRAPPELLKYGASPSLLLVRRNDDRGPAGGTTTGSRRRNDDRGPAGGGFQSGVGQLPPQDLAKKVPQRITARMTAPAVEGSGLLVEC